MRSCSTNPHPATWMLQLIRSTRVCAATVILLGLSGPWYTASGQTFQRRYDPFGQGQLQIGHTILPAANGGHMVFGGSSTWTLDSISPTQFAMRIDSAGNVLSLGRIWDPVTGIWAGAPGSAAMLPDGNFVVAAGSEDEPNGLDPALLRYSNAGDSLAVFVYPQGPGSWNAQTARPAPDGGVIVCGIITGLDLGDAFLLKVDSAWVQQWVQVFGTPGPLEAANSVVPTSDGGFFFGGSRDVGFNTADTWIVRTDALGNVLWSIDIGTPEDELYGAKLAPAANGDLLCASGWNYQGSARYVNGLARVDTAGNVLWWYTYGPNRYAQALQGVREEANGNLIAAGRSLSIPGGYQGVLLRTTATGDSLWMRYYYYQDSLMSDGEGILMDVEPTADGGFVAVGEVYGSNSGDNPPGNNQDVWVLRVDSLGCIEPGCELITGLQAQVANHRDALTVSPNPAAAITHVRWELPGSARAKGAASLWLTSAQGAVVRTWPCDLANGSMTVDVSGLAVGLHHLHLVHNGVWLCGAKLIVE